MFKLRKILNKHNNAPEIESLKISQDSISVAESIYCLAWGELTSNVNLDIEPNNLLFIAYSNVGEYDEERDVVCTRITPDMIFEAKPTTSIIKGNKFKLRKTTDKCGFDSIEPAGADERSDGYVVDASNYALNKTLLVRFHCNQ